MAPSRGAMSREWTTLLLLWCSGFTNACRLDRVYTICRRSQAVRRKMGLCFINGVIVLASVLALERAMLPTLSWLLESHNSGLQTMLVWLYYCTWLCPIYVITYVVNYVRSNEIAEHVFKVVKEAESNSLSDVPRPAIDSFGEHIYSFIVIVVFLTQAFVASFIPYIGQAVYFLLLSWLYAYYCFEYKWGFIRWGLERKLVFFETNWAFFAGFGSPYVLLTFFFSPLVSAGTTAILYPVFVLMAIASDPEQLVASVQNDSPVAIARLPIFFLANKASLVSTDYVFTPLLRLLNRKNR